jgi:tripartite-type tricarboxylate transporter receptor subunit TctC
MKIIPESRAAAFVAAFILAAPGTACAADYPSKTITLICPYAAGGATDGYSRAFADFLEKKKGIKIIVENRDGAGGTVGTEYVKKAAPDGYTIEYLSSSTLLSYRFINKDVVIGRDIDLASGINESQTLWVVNPKVIAVKTFDELLASLRAHPNTPYGSVGSGSTAHLSMLEFAGKQKLAVEHIPYRGGAAAMQALVSGEIGLVAGADPASALPQIKAGTVVPLAATGPARHPSLPDIPTTSELGYPYNITVSFGGFAVPHGTPDEILRKIEDWSREAAADPTFSERLRLLGTEVKFRDSATVTKDINENTERYGAIIKTYNVVQ